MSALRNVRESLGLSLEEVATKCLVDRSTLSRIERGLQQAKPETARRIRKFYRGRISLADIYEPAVKQ